VPEAAQTDFLEVTELPGTPISGEQVERLLSRYRWAADFCAGRDVVEVACGAGPGLGMLAAPARTIEGGDYSEPILEFARRHYGARVPLQRLDAQVLPFPNRSKDVIILFEAIYYLPHPQQFVAECARVLRPGGKVLISSANKDLWDFHPSPHSHRYFGVPELRDLFEASGFRCVFFGYQPAARMALRQRVLRPIKRFAVMSGLMPKTMSGKRWLKRIVFGAQVPMPAELDPNAQPREAARPIADGAPDITHKVIYCAATLGA
jgi:SAM-dependent methyltransferase